MLYCAVAEAVHEEEEDNNFNDLKVWKGFWDGVTFYSPASFFGFVFIQSGGVMRALH